MPRQVFTGSGTLSAAVPSNGTLTVGYPAGTTQIAFQGADAGTDHQVILNSNDAYKATDGAVSVSFGASNVTITNLSGASWPSGTPFTSQLALLDSNVVRGAKPAALTAPSGGATVDQPARDAIVAIQKALKAAGVTN